MTSRCWPSDSRVTRTARQLASTRWPANSAIDSSPGAIGWLGVPHSVVTTSLIDEAGQPTVAARDEILGFFSHRLLAT